MQMESKRKLQWQSLFSDKIDFKIKNILIDKERILKAAREKQHVTYKENPYN